MAGTFCAGDCCFLHVPLEHGVGSALSRVESSVSYLLKLLEPWSVMTYKWRYLLSTAYLGATSRHQLSGSSSFCSRYLPVSSIPAVPNLPKLLRYQHSDSRSVCAWSHKKIFTHQQTLQAAHALRISNTLHLQAFLHTHTGLCHCLAVDFWA